MNALGDLEGKTLGCFGDLLLQLLLGVIPHRSQLTGRSAPKSIFPLPTSRSVLETAFTNLDAKSISWLRCICISLKSFWGGDIDCKGEPNAGQLSCLGGLVKDVSRLCSLDTPLENFSWNDLFKVRSMYYPGEEVKIAVKCFFYTMRVPEHWTKFLAFNKAVPQEVLPQELRGEKRLFGLEGITNGVLK